MNPAPVAFAAIIIVAAAAAAAVAWMALRYRLPPVPLASRRAAGFPPTPVAVPPGLGRAGIPGSPVLPPWPG